ncbi:MAG: TRAP transporter permease, partial [Deltaproteobacteria bacterium]|nr:TRAP transporter permease [Deltaproteobacteria bacterium]
MTPTLTGIIGFVVLIIFMFLRMPVGFVMAIVGYLGFGLLVSWGAASNLLIRDLYSTFGSYNLTVVPLFVFMGQIAFHTGIS